jgi:hypothetical protein
MYEKEDRLLFLTMLATIRNTSSLNLIPSTHDSPLEAVRTVESYAVIHVCTRSAQIERPGGEVLECAVITVVLLKKSPTI